MWDRVEVYTSPWNNECDEWAGCSFIIEDGIVAVWDGPRLKASYAPGEWMRVLGHDDG